MMNIGNIGMDSTVSIRNLILVSFIRKQVLTVDTYMSNTDGLISIYKLFV